jgi:hypothetical protein
MSSKAVKTSARIDSSRESEIYSAVQPPSITSDVPVISDEASLARNTMAPVKSSS